VSESISLLDTPKVRAYITSYPSDKMASRFQIRRNRERSQRRIGVKTTESSIRRARKRWGINGSQQQGEKPRFTKTNDDQAEIVSAPTPGRRGRVPKI
jgi:hypothetical protein